MPTERPDIITVLEKEKAYHLEQVKRINLALAALTGETIPSDDGGLQRQTPPWAQKIDELFESTDEWLTLDEVRNRLAEMGLPEALEKDHRNTVYSTLHRKSKTTKTLEKDDEGRYRGRKPKRRGFDLMLDADVDVEGQKIKLRRRANTVDWSPEKLQKDEAGGPENDPPAS